MLSTVMVGPCARPVALGVVCPCGDVLGRACIDERCRRRWDPVVTVPVDSSTCEGKELALSSSMSSSTAEKCWVMRVWSEGDGWCFGRVPMEFFRRKTSQ